MQSGVDRTCQAGCNNGQCRPGCSDECSADGLRRKPPVQLRDGQPRVAKIKQYRGSCDLSCRAGQCEKDQRHHAIGAVGAERAECISVPPVQSALNPTGKPFGALRRLTTIDLRLEPMVRLNTWCERLGFLLKQKRNPE